MTSDPDSPEHIEREIERDRNALRETLNELQDELSWDGLSRRVSEQFREHGSEWANAASDAARSNPVALALTGVGLAWMIFGRGYDPTHRAMTRRRQPSRPRYRDPTYHSDDIDTEMPEGQSFVSSSSYGRASTSGPHADSPGLGSSGMSASPAGVATSSGASTRGTASLGTASRSEPGWARRTISRARSRLHDTHHQESSMTDHMKDRARHLRDRLSEGTEDLSEEARRRVQDARHRAIRARDSASRRFNESSRSVSDGYEAEPLIFGAAAFLVGAGLATLLPRTRREEELFGSYSQHLFEEAEAIYEEEKAKVRRAVDAGMEEAKSSVSDVKNAAADELSSGSDADKSNTKASGQGTSV
ncbi:MAG: DUF3618 domain-containing protein [Paracoccus sp. (in: a-proteobacteria)]|uniref:DUF3618 domain-containing protein n=1 Tax=Paracoccus sp. TaxID=267 RepID=UPI002E82A321|nr:DUF3618 domain-containing protein [Pseudomonadota bacterium]